jgi:DNA uptake protein ComE-like DNA-binding protein
MYKLTLATCLLIGAAAAACSSSPKQQTYTPENNSTPQKGITTPANYNNNNSPRSAATVPPASSASNAAIVPDVNQQPGQIGLNDSGQQLGSVQRQQGNMEVPTQKVIVQHTNQNVPTVTETKVRADINRMTASDFKALGLSEDEADQVVDYRTHNGPFRSVNDLAKVPDISLNWLADNHSKLAVDPSTTG